MKTIKTIFILLVLVSLTAVNSVISNKSNTVDAAGVESNNVVKTLGFATYGEDAFYKFRVPNGGMDCAGKIRYYFNDDRQLSTIKPAGSCYAVSMKVDYGSGYGGWTNAYNGGFVYINVSRNTRIERVLYRLCTVPSGAVSAVCAKVERVRAHATPYWTLGRCYEKQPLISTTIKQTHKCVKYIQEALKQDQFWPGKVDGIYGSKTEGAVKRFQSGDRYSPALTTDGVFGPQTWAKFINTYSYFTE